MIASAISKPPKPPARSPKFHPKKSPEMTAPTPSAHRWNTPAWRRRPVRARKPGGIGWYDFLRAFQLIVEKKQIVGLDVVELAPIAGLNHPDFFAAKLVYKMLGHVFRQQRASSQRAS